MRRLHVFVNGSGLDTSHNPYLIAENTIGTTSRTPVIHHD